MSVRRFSRVSRRGGVLIASIPVATAYNLFLDRFIAGGAVK